ncbi:HAD family hydrolase [Bordetella sp. 2513F-2]
MTPSALLADRKAIVFDLDGTLLDTVEDIRQAVSLALAECGFAALPPDYRMPDLHGAFPSALVAVMRDRNVPDSLRDALIASYTGHYDRLAHGNSRPYPGLLGFLDDCRRRGVGLAVCTNKRHAPALQALQQTGLLPYFSHVSGSDTVSRPKPDAEPLRQAFAALGVTADQSAYIGDTHVDALSASRAGVPFLLFRSGYGSELVHQYPIAAAFDDYAELLPAGSSQAMPA